MWGSVPPRAGLHPLVGLDQQSTEWVLGNVWAHRVEKQFIWHRGVSVCVYVWSVQACVMSAQGLQAGGANSVCVDLLEPGCVSTRVFTRVRVGAPVSRTVKVAHVQDRSVGLWERRGTPGEALAGTEDTRQGWIYGTECSP